MIRQEWKTEPIQGGLPARTLVRPAGALGSPLERSLPDSMPCASAHISAREQRTAARQSLSLPFSPGAAERPFSHCGAKDGSDASMLPFEEPPRAAPAHVEHAEGEPYCQEGEDAG